MASFSVWEEADCWYWSDEQHPKVGPFENEPAAVNDWVAQQRRQPIPTRLALSGTYLPPPANFGIFPKLR